MACGVQDLVRAFCVAIDGQTSLRSKKTGDFVFCMTVEGHMEGQDTSELDAEVAGRGDVVKVILLGDSAVGKSK